MCSPIVVDANCINLFQHERITGNISAASEAIAHIFANGWLVLDEGGLCQQEWLDCASGPAKLNLADWIAEQAVSGNLKLVKVEKHNELKAKLKEFGMPKKDSKWIELGQSSGAFGVVSEDSDLFEPKSKRWSAAKKRKIKNERSGCVCTYARRKLGLEIMTLDQVPTLVPPCET